MSIHIPSLVLGIAGLGGAFLPHTWRIVFLLFLFIAVVLMVAVWRCSAFLALLILVYAAAVYHDVYVINDYYLFGYNMLGVGALFLLVVGLGLSYMYATSCNQTNLTLKCGPKGMGNCDSRGYIFPSDMTDAQKDAAVTTIQNTPSHWLTDMFGLRDVNQTVS